MIQRTEPTPGGEMLPMPLPEKKASIAEAVAAAAGMNISSAAALIGVLKEKFTADDAQFVLWKRAGRIRSLATCQEPAQELGFCELLMSKGADPLLASENEKRWSSDRSLVGALVEAGAWQYAGLLVGRAGPAGKQRALALLGQEEGNLHRLHVFLGTRGPHAIAFGADIGMDMSATVFDAPWAAMSASAADLAAFAKAGADLSARDSRGRSLAEIFAQRDAGAARQALLKAVAAREDSPRGEAAVAMMEKIASEGSFKEFAALAKGAGLSPAKTLASNGRTMLGVALESANWTMARGLMAAGANPMEPCGADGIPAGAHALLGSAVKRKTRAQVEAEGAILEGIFSKMDFSWRSADGLPMLEAAAASARRAQPRGFFWNASAAAAWGAAEPESADNPLWARALDLGVQDRAVAAIAGKRIGESEWSPSGVGVLEWAATKTTVDNGEGSAVNILVQARREAAASSPASAANDDKVMNLFTRKQWEATIKSFWSVAARAHEKRIAEGEHPSTRSWQVEYAAQKIQKAMAHWAREAEQRGIKSIDEKDLAEWAFGSWSDGDPYCGKWAGGILVGAVRRGAPPELGGLVLDLACKGTPEAIKAACEVWRRMETYGLSGALPQEHPIYAADAALIAELDLTGLGKAIEGKRPKPSAEPPAPPVKSTRRL